VTTNGWNSSSEGYSMVTNSSGGAVGGDNDALMASRLVRMVA
jgi:hypothetical protein